ncbi:hypothetical protein CC86DRAFT_4605 [Ophiobolus disseminans]|uniref:F-box domain-containing protein n=1 Tax=Ophiobolus disseminans TaxID=1469910 RepID=A0A6A7AIH0_9PLEO|nr:hypothetical protein CC86DRAFT_4605 [Ophiobolus disseminans]
MATLQHSKGLVEDVTRIVFEYISLSTDLQALCLVSRDWNYVATERLYGKIVLNIHDLNGQLNFFEGSLRCGASKHLRYLRSLNLYDTSLYGQSDLYDTSLYQQSNHFRDSVEDRPTNDEVLTKQEAILRILRQLPANKLHTFRYISCLGLASDCIQYLERHQQSIRDLHVTQCDPRLLASSNRRNLTAGFCNKDHKTHVFAEVVKSIPQLESIWLNFLPGWTPDVAQYWAEESCKPLAGHTIRSRELAISGYMPLGFTRNIPQMFDLAIVTSLVLNDFNLWVLAESLVPSDALCNLVHFRCSTLDAVVPEHATILQKLFERNTRLKHVQLSLGGLAHYPHNPPESMTIEDYIDPASILWSLHCTLETLAWHDMQRTISNDGDSPRVLGYLCPSSLESFARNFPRVQQLGLKAPDQPLLDAEHANWKEDFLAYLEPLKDLKDLRMLQLYQEHLSPVQGGVIRPTNEIVSDIQRFASFLFQSAHAQQSRFKVLIWGTHGAAVDIDMLIATALGDGDYELVPQLFFVKRVERRHDGVDRVYATATTRGQLRDEFPDLDMLTYDPGFRELDRQAVRI